MTAKLIETNCRQCNKVLTNDSPDGIYCDEKCGLEVFEISHSYFELVEISAKQTPTRPV